MVHEIHSSGSAGDEEHLHDGVVEADEAGEKVKIPADKHHQEQDLRLAGDSCAASRLPDLHEEEDDGQEMRQVSKQSEDVHPGSETLSIVSIAWQMVNL